ncbi:Dynein regulatory complex subunit 7 [Saguinus oedipus]|uniref:Dynein regulatory complex subunit 7 n=1 Tax=Saguinus oedipus TaxID=9490 RepID=A0ABQ9TK59_SAGOE|nr:Dynein regulatory complex subunit 7 [Saguinus oedipus]
MHRDLAVRSGFVLAQCLYRAGEEFSAAPADPADSPSPLQERVMHEEHLQQVETQLDYLAPFLVQLPPGEKLTRWQAVRLKDECLSDFKQRLINKANLIQARFEKETQELQKKQQWYQENQVTLTPEDEDLYLSYCSQAMFRIRILEQRLNRHKELAPLKYLALEEKLHKDPRLGELLKMFT